ncbi:hypothetical protein CsatA_029162 [Cannabis sativa]
MEIKVVLDEDLRVKIIDSNHSTKDLFFRKTVLKVVINCEKCKKDILQAITKLSGIDEIVVDAEKDSLTVVGEVDPIMLAKKIKKNTGKVVDILSVGPPKQPQPPKPPVVPVVEKLLPLPICCSDCQLVDIITFSSYYNDPSCNIL